MKGKNKMDDKKVIELEFDKTLSGLAGYDYGKDIYKKQVKNKIDFKQKTCIVFPNNIQRIASSFVQGFFEEIIANAGISSVGNTIDIKCVNEELKQSIVDNL